MARARNIKPGFFLNADLAEAGPICQLLFAGLWCLADKEGRVKNDHRRIKAEIFPYYDANVNGYLTVLSRLGNVLLYSVNGVKVIQIVNFKNHQSPHHTEKASVLPGPDHPSVCFEKTPESHGDLTVNSRKSNGEYPSDSLIPDSLIPDSKNKEPPYSPLSKPQKSRSRKRSLTDTEYSNFERFYSVYPKKQARGEAEKAWKKLSPDDELIKAIIAAVEKQKMTLWADKDMQFIPLPASWLRGKRWLDDTKLPNIGETYGPHPKTLDDYLALRERRNKQPNNESQTERTVEGDFFVD